ncbi:hypothetical protein FPQ18DRAFT_259599 [Pyronema domesticum]|nr:hypothetical protein FPQ18DRAFT_259599 [Pyronema domesticum]
MAGCICSLAHHLCIENSLAKNARVTVMHFFRHMVEVKLISTVHNSADSVFYLLHTINFDFKPRYTPFTVGCQQFPLCLVYTMTFNSCQGLTLDLVVLDIQIAVFA